jgi:hypothetical protein
MDYWIDLDYYEAHLSGCEANRLDKRWTSSLSSLALQDEARFLVYQWGQKWKLKILREKAAIC